MGDALRRHQTHLAGPLTCIAFSHLLLALQTGCCIPRGRTRPHASAKEYEHEEASQEFHRALALVLLCVLVEGPHHARQCSLVAGG